MPDAIPEHDDPPAGITATLVMPKPAWRPGVVVNAHVRLTNTGAATRSVTIGGQSVDDGTLVDAAGKLRSGMNWNDVVPYHIVELAPGRSFLHPVTVRTATCGSGGPPQALPEGDYTAAVWVDVSSYPPGESAPEPAGWVVVTAPVTLDTSAPLATAYTAEERATPYAGGTCTLSPGHVGAAPESGWSIRLDVADRTVRAGDDVVGTVVATYRGADSLLAVDPAWNPSFLRDDDQVTPVSVGDEPSETWHVRDGDSVRFPVRIPTRGCPASDGGEQPALPPGTYELHAGLAVDGRAGDYSRRAWLASPVEITLTAL